MKRETDLDGSKDENVFDIQPGVAICLMIKHRFKSGIAKIHHAHLYGLRRHKYEVLLNTDLENVSWTEVIPSAPFYLFASQDFDLRREYQDGWKLPEIMPVNSVGVVTGQDQETIGFTREEANQLARQHHIPESKVVPILYRTFDMRFMVYDKRVVTRPRLEVMQHMFATKNPSIVCTRQQSVQGTWGLVGVANRVIEGCYISNKTAEINYIFPTYLSRRVTGFQGSMFADSHYQSDRSANFAPVFITNLSSRINMQFIPDGMGDLKKTFGPQDIFHYIYAILHSPTYRARYAEFLKIDFPRVPLTRNLDLFRALVAKGADLVALHLMESPALDKAITKFVGRGDNVVASGYPKYEKKTVWINAEQGFEGVPQNVYEFHIGGYQVCHKWLKDRRKRTLSSEDKTHYAKIVVALQETIRLMQEIDEVIPSWPIE